VIEISEEFVEAVVRRQMLIKITEVILAVLSGHVTVILKQTSDCWVFFGKTFLCTRQAYLQQAGPKRTLSRDKRRPTCGAALLSVPVREQCAFCRDAIDIRGSVTHHAAVISAGIHPANVVTPYDEDIGFILCRSCRRDEQRCQ